MTARSLVRLKENIRDRRKSEVSREKEGGTGEENIFVHLVEAKGGGRS
jgi:hypothetical protein